MWTSGHEGLHERKSDDRLPNGVLWVMERVRRDYEVSSLLQVSSGWVAVPGEIALERAQAGERWM